MGDSKKIGSSGRGIVLDVTPEIINLAVRRDSSHCVIADALRAAVPEATYVTVDLQTIRFSLRGCGRRFVYLTPAPAQAVLVNFDQGTPPDPFTMRLGYPAQILRAGKENRARNKSKTKARGKAPTQPDGLPPGERRKVTSTRNGHTPQIKGGPYPPTAALSNTRGRRRTFGLKSLRP